jgi:hypothetical protein
MKYSINLNSEGPQEESLPKLSLGNVIKLTSPIISVISSFEGFENARLMKIIPWII